MKGIVLAGGSGTRLSPLTLGTSKQMLPIYDKPMIYYPLATIMLAGVNDIMIISTPEDLPNFKRLLGDGKKIGIKISYKIQPSPDGLAQALILGSEFIGDDECVLILGDNFFYGSGFSEILGEAMKNAEAGRATVFGYYVPDPERFGVVEFDDNYHVKSVEEKPVSPKSNYAITGLYFYPKGASKKAKRITPSNRGELEITALNKMYLEEGLLDVKLLGRGYVWLDAGTVDSLADASEFVRVIQNRQGVKIAALEEIAFRNGWIDKESLLSTADDYKKTDYGKHLYSVVQGKMKDAIQR